MYDVTRVETVILEVVVELVPQCLPVKKLSSIIVSDPRDRREMETLEHAVRNLREVGLFQDRNDEIVEPTPAGFHAVGLLA